MGRGGRVGGGEEIGGRRRRRGRVGGGREGGVGELERVGGLGQLCPVRLSVDCRADSMSSCF